RTVNLALVGIDQIADQNRLEAGHINFSVVSALDVGEIGGIARMVVGMAVRTAGTWGRSAGTFSHANSLDIEIWDIFRRRLGLIGRASQATEGQRKHASICHSQKAHKSSLEKA